MSEIAVSQEQDLRDLAEQDDDSLYCHIVDQSLSHFYCGRRRTGPLTCRTYHGEAICPDCGLPTCVRCSVLSDLNARLEGLT